MTDSFGGFFEKTASGGGSGAPSFDFGGQSEVGIGRSVVGEIVDLYEGVITDIDTKEPKLDKNGKQQPQLSVTLQTDLRNWQGAKKPGTDPETGEPLPASEDTGLRRVYLRYKAARRVGDAIKEAGGTFDDFKANIGAQLYMKRIENDGRMHDFQVAFKKGEASAAGFFGSTEAPAPQPPAGDPFTQTTATPPVEPTPTPSGDPFGGGSAPSDEPPF